MKTICLSTWEEFEEQLLNLEAIYTQRKNESESGISDMLFRGQERSEWKLETTLERAVSKEYRMYEYFSVIHSIMPEIEAFTGQNWQTPSTVTEYLQLLQNNKPAVMYISPVYEYMSHLRHHGFPSPLLDWTMSPYIASYFAFRGATDQNASIAIYAYIEYAGKGKRGRRDEPWIDSLGPRVRAHPRHFLQKSQYTICTRHDGTDHWYASHEQVFERESIDQDLLWKFTIPASERQKVLRLLDRFNINSFSLFGSEESLMESLAIREFPIRE